MPVKAPAAPAPQKPFGAPAGSVDVRSHIPKKGTVDLSVHALVYSILMPLSCGESEYTNICTYILLIMLMAWGESTFQTMKLWVGSTELDRATTLRSNTYIVSLRSYL